MRATRAPRTPRTVGARIAHRRAELEDERATNGPLGTPVEHEAERAAERLAEIITPTRHEERHVALARRRKIIAYAARARSR